MIYVFLAPGFEEVEALCPADLLKRAGFDVKLVSVDNTDSVAGAHGFVIGCDMGIDEIKDFSCELLFLPGGMPGTTNLAANPTLREALIEAADAGRPIAAICAAPSVLGSLGILNGKCATCYPGFEGYLEGANISDQRVVRDGNILTGAGVGVAYEFGLAAIEMLSDKGVADKIRRSTVG